MRAPLVRKADLESLKEVRKRAPAEAVSLIDMAIERASTEDEPIRTIGYFASRIPGQVPEFTAGNKGQLLKIATRNIPEDWLGLLVGLTTPQLEAVLCRHRLQMTDVEAAVVLGRAHQRVNRSLKQGEAKMQQNRIARDEEFSAKTKARRAEYAAVNRRYAA